MPLFKIKELQFM